ncbi:SulP family inorganic anion transporter [Desulfofalx alkaliphila]|uniref:SulP family inorganic anion transporter n=1 Tax=Desulfofalx alkaliphila TaxID=105483 RepID=UPI000A0424E1|nr:SulP family inorganic anion transporter [Desulfofalx alkaliphila]
MLNRIYREFLAGITVAVVALPLALAFGVAATGTPEGALFGLYGAIFAGFFAALFGGTKGQVTGPTGPITVVATGVIAKFGIELALVVFIMAGIIQIALGLLRLGSYVKYIPHPVVSGFMNGIALIIILGQLQHVQDNILLVALTMAIIYLSDKWIKFMPSSLVGLIGGTILAVAIFPSLEGFAVSVPLLHQFFVSGSINFIGSIPQALPSLHFPPLTDPGLILTLLPSAVSIALLGAIDSLLTSVVMDNITGTRHDSNKELVGQGIGNIASGLFGGLAGAGATVRSVVNIRNGGRTALSACIHSVVLLILVLSFGNATAYIPMAALAGILIVTGISMFDRNSFKTIPTTPKSDVFVMLLTMVITVAVDLMVAVGIGIAISALLFAKEYGDRGVKVTKLDNISSLNGEDIKTINENASIFAIEGPIYFGSTDRIIDSIINSTDKQIIVLRLDGVQYIDGSGMMALHNLLEQLSSRGKKVIFSNIDGTVEQRIKNIDAVEPKQELRILPHKEAYNYILEHSRALACETKN